MGTRVIKTRGTSAVQRRREFRALATILCAVVLPSVSLSSLLRSICAAICRI